MIDMLQFDDLYFAGTAWALIEDSKDASGGGLRADEE